MISPWSWTGEKLVVRPDRSHQSEVLILSVMHCYMLLPVSLSLVRSFLVSPAALIMD